MWRKKLEMLEKKIPYVSGLVITAVFNTKKLEKLRKKYLVLVI